MIGAGIQPHDSVRLDVGDHERAFAVFLRIGRKDRETQLARRNTHVAARYCIQHDAAGIKNQHLLFHRAGIRHPDLAGRASTPEGDIDEIFPRNELKRARAAFRGRHQRQLAIGAGNGAENPPGQALFDRLALLGQMRLERDILCGRPLCCGIRDHRVEAVELRHLLGWRGDCRKRLEGVGKLLRLRRTGGSCRKNERYGDSANGTGLDAHGVVDILSVWLHLKRRYGIFVAAFGGAAACAGKLSGNGRR